VLIELLPLLLGLAGIAIAFVLYILRPGLPAIRAARFRGLYLFLLNKWYFDELYEAIFVQPAKQIGYALWKGGDGGTIDRLGPDGVSALTRDIARRAGRLQTGYVYHYAFAMLIGVVLLISWYLAVQAR
jgi:NADH-quinone oxidoreductase subunit L